MNNTLSSRLTLLVPRVAKERFEDERVSGYEPVFYESTHASLFQRALRKLGLRDTQYALKSRFKVAEGADRLEQVFAFWLSPQTYLSPPLMGCLLDRMPGLKWVYSQAAGTDHLDLSMFRQRGVMVSNSGELSSRKVAEMVLACVCAHAKRLPEHIALQRRRKWQSLPPDDLSDQKVGVIGTGNIGKHVATLCRAIGMHVVGASRNPERFGDDPAPFHRLVRLNRELNLLLAECDHIVLALPLNEETRGLIGRNELRKMKKNASLINVARGAIVNEGELCAALSEGRIGAAYIDTPTRLPPSFWSPLYTAHNLVLTHYSAAHNPQLLKCGFEQFLGGLRHLMQTGEPPDRVA